MVYPAISFRRFVEQHQLNLTKARHQVEMFDHINHRQTQKWMTARPMVMHKKISFLGNNAHASSEVAYRVMNAISDFTFLVFTLLEVPPINEVLMVFVFTFAILDSDCCGGKCADNIQYALTHSSIDSHHRSPRRASSQ